MDGSALKLKQENRGIDLTEAFLGQASVGVSRSKASAIRVIRSLASIIALT
jgi:hypothetical protein